MQQNRLFTFLVTACLVAISQVACGNANFREGRRALDRGDHQLAISELSKAVQKQPANPAFLRELGIAYLQSNQYEEALQFLDQARRLAPRDARVALHLGLAYERLEKFDQALATYGTSTELDASGELAQELRAAAHRLAFKMKTFSAGQEANSDEDHDFSPNSLAVLYFRNVAELKEWEPLLKGLAATLIEDLATVRSLHLIERAKIEEFLKDNDLTPAKLYDRFTAPRAGRALGVYRVIVGGASTAGEAAILIDAGVLETASGTLVGRSVSFGGRLSEILRIEKELAFALLQQLGVALSESERESIAKVPTESAQAFASYCRGLEAADRRDLTRAQKFFKEALDLDSDFRAAKNELEKLAAETRKE